MQSEMLRIITKEFMKDSIATSAADDGHFNPPARRRYIVMRVPYRKPLRPDSLDHPITATIKPSVQPLQRDTRIAAHGMVHAHMSC